jgi:hypothetical protein
MLLVLSFLCSAAQQEKVTGFFTNMHYVPEAGDVVGMEVWIVYARGNFYACVQQAQGEPEPPVVVPVKVSGAEVRFSLQGPQPLAFIGTVSKTGLALSVAGSKQPPEMLKRQSSYWK